MRIIIISVLVVLFSGCTTIQRLTDVDAASWGDRFDDDYACLATVKSANEKDALTFPSNKATLKHNRGLWIEEVKRRGIVNDREWKLIASNKISEGMRKCALYMSWGRPYSENRSVHRGVVRIQHVYGRGNYVYTKDGVVTSWQSSTAIRQ